MPYACIYVPDFAVEAALRTDPQSAALRQQPVAVLDGAPLLVRVACANGMARMAGIEPGLSRLQAEACPGVLLRRRVPLQEEAAHAALVDCARSFSPRVEATTQDTIVADLDGLESLFGAPAILARDLARRVGAAGMEANVAVAANPDAAILAARGFTGVTIIAPGTEAERLGALSIDVLTTGDAGDTQQLLEVFDRWGVRNLRALSLLPAVPLVERLGQRGLHLQKQARGEVVRTIVPVDEQLSFHESFEFEDAVELLEPLAFILARLLECICVRLTARALATNELRLTCGLEPHRDMQLRGTQDQKMTRRDEAAAEESHAVLRLPVPMNDAAIFLKLLQLELRAHPPCAPVKRLRLAVEAVPPRASQTGLFLPAMPQPEVLELTLARLARVVQTDAAEPPEARIGSPQLLDTHRPEGFRMTRFTPPAPDHFPNHFSDHVAPGPIARELPVTALRICRPPVELRVELKNEAPARLWMAGKTLSVITAAGPWRGSGEWWAAAWTREEWDVSLQLEKNRAALWRLFRDPATGKWFKHAEYD